MMHRTMGWLLVLLMVLALAAHAQPDTVRVTLEEALARAVVVSPDLLAARAKVSYSDARTDLARASRFLTDFQIETAFAMVPGLTNPNGAPVTELYLDPAVRNDFGSLSLYIQSDLEIIQPVYTFGALRGNVQAAAYGARADRDAAEVMEKDVALRTADLYFGALLATALLALTDDARDVLERAAREVDRLLADGDPEVDEADRYQVLITEQELEARIREVTETRAIALAALSRQLFPDQDVVALPAEARLEPMTFVPRPLTEYQSIALAGHPLLRQARAGLQAREWQMRAARADYYPQIVFGFGASVTGAANRHRQPNPFVSDPFRRSSVRAGFGFRQKLNFAQTRAGVQQAQAQWEEVRHMGAAARQLVLMAVEQTYRELSVAEAGLAAQDSSLAISKEWLRVETINFDFELGSTENLLDAVRANLDLEARYLDAVRRYNAAIVRLQHAAGTLHRDAGTSS